MGQHLAVDLSNGHLSIIQPSGILHGSWETDLHQLPPELGIEKITRMMMKIIMRVTNSTGCLANAQETCRVFPIQSHA